MNVVKGRRRASSTPAPARNSRGRPARAGRRLAGALTIARSAGRAIVNRVPGTIRATRTGAGGTTSALQVLPDPMLRWLAAGSVGLGAGLSLAGAPRLVVAAGMAPALIIGAAIASRPGAHRVES
ncbi:MAG: hypothetical protein ACHQ01_10030 [Candidatus Limnocylindrales bacterium]